MLRRLGLVAATGLLLAIHLVSGNRTQAITDGSVIQATELQAGAAFEWLVRLENVNGTNRCSGSLVGSVWVLSAYHCSTASDPTSGVTRAFIGGSQVPISIIEEYRLSQTDAVLLKLATAANANIQPALIAPYLIALQGEGEEVEIAGWGVTQVNAEAPESPSSGSATVVSTAGDSMVLEGNPSLGCSGDSGGPVFIRESRGVVIYGVISASDISCSSWNVAVANSAFAKDAMSLTGQDVQPPTVQSGNLRTAVNRSVPVPFAFSDTGGWPMTFANITSFLVEHGEFSGCDEDTPPTTCEFVPEPDFTGMAKVQYTVTDGVNEATGTWDIEVYIPTTVFVDPVRVSEPDASARGPRGRLGLIPVSVRLTGPVSRPVIVDVQPSGGTATLGRDYLASRARIVLTDRIRTGSIWIMVMPDMESEFDETISFTVTASGGAEVEVATPVVTIVGDRQLPNIPPSVGFLNFQIYEDSCSCYIVGAEVSDPDGSEPLTEANLSEKWFVSLEWDASAVEVVGMLIETSGGVTTLYIGFRPVTGFTGTTTISLTVTDERGDSTTASKQVVIS